MYLELENLVLSWSGMWPGLAYHIPEYPRKLQSFRVAIMRSLVGQVLVILSTTCNPDYG